MTTLGVHGRFIMVAIPDDNLPQLHSSRKSFRTSNAYYALTFPPELSTNGALLGGSHMCVNIRLFIHFVD